MKSTVPWPEQCAAARRLKAGLGAKVAIDYLLGEKLPRFLRRADRDPSLIPEVPRFVAEISRIFSQREVREHMPGVRYVRAVLGVDGEAARELLDRMRMLLMSAYGTNVLARRQPPS